MALSHLALEIFLQLGAKRSDSFLNTLDHVLVLLDLVPMGLFKCLSLCILRCFAAGVSHNDVFVVGRIHLLFHLNSKGRGSRTIRLLEILKSSLF